MPKWIRRRVRERETEYTQAEGGKGGAHGYGEEVEGTKGLSAPCLPRINHVSVMLNRWPPARHESIGSRWHIDGIRLGLFRALNERRILGHSI